MATKKVTWQEKTSATEFDTIYPQTVADQVKLNNTINNNLGIDVDSRLDKALESISDTDKRIRAQGTSTGNALALELSVPTFELLDGTMARVKVHVNTSANATLNVNNTGAKPIIRIDGEPIDLELKQGTWCIFIYSATLDSWVFEGWSTKAVTKTAIFTESGTWTVPANVTSVDVFLMGGGGGGGYTSNSSDSSNDFRGYGQGGGGGGGYMAKSTLTVTPGTSVSITVGAGGASGASGGNGGNGGTTSFGSSLSAQGGGGGKYGQSTSSSGTGGDGGNGGSGGGGGSSSYTYPNPDFNTSGGASHYTVVTKGGKGGNGAQFGGGGGYYLADGGAGGTYGGGGGGGGAYKGGIGGKGGAGGTYGGKGGDGGYGTKATGANGTDTRNIEGLDFIGAGTGGLYSTSDSDKREGAGGGGGYGGNGGKGGWGQGGGGGGYGGNGAEGGNGGGGGGYGGNANGHGGGGYGADNYGCGGDSASAGKSGICIITYQTQEA